MRRPIIGITMDSHDGKDAYYLGFDYAKAVERAGGVPLAIPYKTSTDLIPEILNVFDGVLFTGGNDLDPALYGEAWHPEAQKIDPDRQNFELALLAEVERRRLPTLAICLG
jgi:putative glutamine amidotransferase